ncbi:MAG: hypothetical protein DWQ19_11405 [Crenarchaeota archaeon]|nr:MAG: hypothetical protein DWQ19_11405 [Thermoproteota archaeon]
MRILDAGHVYEIDCIDGEEAQKLSFVKREGPGYPFNKGSHPGTNVREVIRCLIDRTKYLNNQKPCAETESALECLKTALFLYEARAARRHNRHLKLASTNELMYREVCDGCKHVGCEGHCSEK